MYAAVRRQIQATLDEISEAGLFKHERLLDSAQQSHVESNHRRLLNFCSNNYLGFVALKLNTRPRKTLGFQTPTAPLQKAIASTS